MEDAQQEIFTPIDKPSRKKRVDTVMPAQCEHCQNDFMARGGQRFCSSKCRLNSFRSKQGLGNTQHVPEPTQNEMFNGYTTKPVSTTSSFKSLEGSIPVHAQYVIDSQKREIDRWEKEHSRAQNIVDKQRDEIEKLRNEITTMKTEAQINAVRDEKPSGLNGLMESPGMQQLMPFIGPALGKFAEKMADAIPVPGQNQTPPAHQLNGASDNVSLASISEWFLVQPEHIQQHVFEFMNKLAQVPEDQIPAKLQLAFASLNGVKKQNNGSNYRFQNN